MSLEEKFLAAVDVVNSLPKNGPFQPSQELALKFNAYYKQATEGPCNTPKPSFFDGKKHEWYAWKSLEEMSKEAAMEKYIEQLAKVVETMSYTEAVSKFIDLMGPFYEIVWPEDEEDEIEQSVDTEKYGVSGHEASCVVSDDTSKSVMQPKFRQNEHHSEESIEILFHDTVPDENFTKVKRLKFGHYKGEWNTSGPDFQKVHETENSVVEISQQQAIPSTKPCIPTTEVISESVVNLQKSLDEIVNHLGALEVLAKRYQRQLREIRRDSNKKTWKITPFAVMVAFLWPFIVHWIVHIVRKRNIAKSL